MRQSHPADAADRIRSIADRAGFDNTVGDLAVQVFASAADNDVVEPDVERDDAGKFSGDHRDYPPGALPAAVYAAARLRDVPTKPGEVATAADDDAVTADDVTEHYRDMLRALPYEVEPEDPDDWVRRIADELDATDDFRTTAVDLCRDAVDANLHTGKSVSGFAAAVVYATSEHTGGPYGQDAIATVADVSPVTIRNQYRDILSLWDDAAVPGSPDAIDAAINDVCDAVDGVPERVRSDALSIAADVTETDADFVTGTDPKGVAAGIVYIAATNARDVPLAVSQTKIGDAAGVSKSTVVNRVNDVRDWKRRQKYERMNYNRLKELAADRGLDVGMTPERDYLIDRLVADGEGDS